MNSVPGSEEAGRALVGQVLVGRYRVEALLGTGGMGSVYRAEHVHMRKAVAIKVLHRELTLFPEVVARFEREAVAAGRIEHRHVAAAKDFGRLDDGSFYLVLEFVEGRSLGATIDAEGAFGEERSLRIARQIADGLAAAHLAGIVHRDLKPENVMLLEKEGSGDFVKVLDFGIAKLKVDASSEQQPQLTQLGTIFGTPEYMSPEQAQGMDVDARSDIYALGILLYEMLAGDSPFHHDEIVVMLTRQITMDPPPLPASVSAATAELTLQLLRKNPAERPETAAEVRDRIDQILGGAPASGIQAPLPPISSARASSASFGNGADVAHAQTALVLPGSGKQRFLALWNLVHRARLGRPIAILGYAVPLGVLLGVAGVLAVVIALSVVLFSMGEGTSAGAAPSDAAGPAPSDPDMLAVIAKAETGDRTAIAVLAGRPPEGRSLVEWRALGHGYCAIGELKACLDVYAAGIRAMVELGSDPIVLGDLRRVAEREVVGTQALDLAARSLGATGADLLYDVWESGRSPNATGPAKRARALLDEEPARSQQSPALRSLFQLLSAMKKPKCSELKRILPDVARDADERAVPTLTRLNDRRGCGFFGLGDCYSCLRTTKELSRALEAARSRPKPAFSMKLPTPSPSAR